MLLRADDDRQPQWSRQPARRPAGWSIRWSTWALQGCLLGWLILAWVVLDVGYDRTPLLDQELAAPRSVPADQLANAYHALWAATGGLIVADAVVVALFLAWLRGRGEGSRWPPPTDGWAVAAWRVRALRTMCPSEPASDIWWNVQRRQQLRRLGRPRGASVGLKVLFGLSIFWAIGALPPHGPEGHHEADVVFLLGMHHIALAVLLLRVVVGAPTPHLPALAAPSLEVR